MAFRWPWERTVGTTPVGMIPITYSYDYPQHNYQVKERYPWPNVPAHETWAALSNAWGGNQLPGPTNFIPGVELSKFTWNVPTSYANTLMNQQYNKAFNIQGYGNVQNAIMMKQIQQAWQNRSGF